MPWGTLPRFPSWFRPKHLTLPPPASAPPAVTTHVPPTYPEALARDATSPKPSPRSTKGSALPKLARLCPRVLVSPYP